LDNQVIKGNEQLETIENLQTIEPLVRCFQPPDSIIQLTLTCSFILKNFLKHAPKKQVVGPPEFERGLENHLKLWFESPVRSLLSDVTKRLRHKVL